MTTPSLFPTLPRSGDWPDLLSQYLIGRMDMPFAWGSHDCCLFAADWVLLCLGQDPATGFRGKYRTQKTGLKILREQGGVRSLVDRQFTRTTINFAHRGDLVCYKDPGLTGPAWAVNSLGILDGRLALFASESGLRVVRRGQLMKTAWRVGTCHR